MRATDVGRQRDRLVPEPGDQPLVPVTEAEDALHAVLLGQFQHQPAHDVVQPRTQPAAGDDARPQRARIEEDLVARPRQLEGGQGAQPSAVRPQVRQAVVHQHLVGLADEVHGTGPQVRRHRRGQQALAQVLDGHVLRGDRRGPARRGLDVALALRFPGPLLLQGVHHGWRRCRRSGVGHDLQRHSAASTAAPWGTSAAAEVKVSAGSFAQASKPAATPR